MKKIYSFIFILSILVSLHASGYGTDTTNDSIDMGSIIIFVIAPIVIIWCILEYSTARSREKGQYHSASPSNCWYSKENTKDAEKSKQEEKERKQEAERKRLEKERKQKAERKRLEEERKQEEERRRLEEEERKKLELERKEEEERKRLEKERKQEEERRRLEEEERKKLELERKGEEERKKKEIEKESILLPKIFQGACRLDFYYQFEEEGKLSLQLEVENDTAAMMNYCILVFRMFSDCIKDGTNKYSRELELKIKNRTNNSEDLAIYYGLRSKRAVIRDAINEIFGRFKKYGFIYDYGVVSGLLDKLCSGEDISINANIKKGQAHAITTIFGNNYKMYFYSCINEKLEFEIHMELTDGCGYIENRKLLTVGVSPDSIKDVLAARKTYLGVSSLGELQRKLRAEIERGDYRDTTVIIYYGVARTDVKLRHCLNELFEEYSKYGFIYNSNTVKHIISDLSRCKTSLICNGEFVEASGCGNEGGLKDVFKADDNDTIGNTDDKKEISLSKMIISGKNDNLSRLLKELDSMIGLSSVKNEVRAIVNQIKVDKVKKEKGIKVSKRSMHLVFIGNPGTGKTTVARLLGKIYKELGVIKKDLFVETDRSKFVAEYMGQTAIKTETLVKSALGGILFIDEAYALNQGENDEYGNEAVSTLLKLMEDYRGNLIVIIAGYTKEISEFLKTNSGLESRFPTTIHFEDYNADELVKIFYSLCQKDKNSTYVLSADAKDKLASIITFMYETRTDNFANAREVRNLFEKVIKNQTTRLGEIMDGGKIMTRKKLLTIEPEDFASV